MVGLGCGVWGLSMCPPAHRRERGAITRDRAAGEVPVLMGFGRSHAADHFCDLSCGTGGARSA